MKTTRRQAELFLKSIGYTNVKGWSNEKVLQRLHRAAKDAASLEMREDMVNFFAKLQEAVKTKTPIVIRVVKYRKKAPKNPRDPAVAALPLAEQGILPASVSQKTRRHMKYFMETDMEELLDIANTGFMPEEVLECLKDMGIRTKRTDIPEKVLRKRLVGLLESGDEKVREIFARHAATNGIKGRLNLRAKGDNMGRPTTDTQWADSSSPSYFIDLAIQKCAEWESLGDIAERAGLDPNQVRNRVNYLTRAGLVESRTLGFQVRVNPQSVEEA